MSVLDLDLDLGLGLVSESLSVRYVSGFFLETLASFCSIAGEIPYFLREVGRSSAFLTTKFLTSKESVLVRMLIGSLLVLISTSKASLFWVMRMSVSDMMVLSFLSECDTRPTNPDVDTLILSRAMTMFEFFISSSA